MSNDQNIHDTWYFYHKITKKKIGPFSIEALTDIMIKNNINLDHILICKPGWDKWKNPLEVKEFFNKFQSSIQTKQNLLPEVSEEDLNNTDHKINLEKEKTVIISKPQLDNTKTDLSIQSNQTATDFKLEIETKEFNLEPADEKTVITSRPSEDKTTILKAPIKEESKTQPTTQNAEKTTIAKVSNDSTSIIKLQGEKTSIVRRPTSLKSEDKTKVIQKPTTPLPEIKVQTEEYIKPIEEKSIDISKNIVIENEAEIDFSDKPEATVTSINSAQPIPKKLPNSKTEDIELKTVIVMGDKSFRTKSIKISLEGLEITSALPEEFLNKKLDLYLYSPDFKTIIKLEAKFNSNNTSQNKIDFISKNENALSNLETWIQATTESHLKKIA